MLLELDAKAGVAVIHGIGCGTMDRARCVPIVDKAHAREVIANRGARVRLEVCDECDEAGRLRVLVPNRRFADD